MGSRVVAESDRRSDLDSCSLIDWKGASLVGAAPTPPGGSRDRTGLVRSDALLAPRYESHDEITRSLVALGFQTLQTVPLRWLLGVRTNGRPGGLIQVTLRQSSGPPENSSVWIAAVDSPPGQPSSDAVFALHRKVLSRSLGTAFQIIQLSHEGGRAPASEWRLY